MISHRHPSTSAPTVPNSIPVVQVAVGNRADQLEHLLGMGVGGEVEVREIRGIRARPATHRGPVRRPGAAGGRPRRTPRPAAGATGGTGTRSAGPRAVTDGQRTHRAVTIGPCPEAPRTRPGAAGHKRGKRQRPVETCGLVRRRGRVAARGCSESTRRARAAWSSTSLSEIPLGARSSGAQTAGVGCSGLCRRGTSSPERPPEQAAVREVAEETGIAGEILGSLGTIDFWFIAEGRRVHKTVHHFLLRAVGGELSDADIEVTKVEWVPLPADRRPARLPGRARPG